MTDPALSLARLPRIDAARGGAVVAMVLYHLSWDLNHFGWLTLNLFASPAWLAARAGILSAFLFLAGVSLVLSTRGGRMDRRRFGRRWALLAAAAAAITAVSLAVFPQSPILFGVLHHLAVGSLLGLAFLRLPAAVTALAGVAVLALPQWMGFPLFDSPWLSWVGLVTHEPDANDYVPLFPWFGVLLLGMAAGRLWGERAGGGAPASLAWLGRHSLPVYLIHQPVLFGLLWGITAAGLSPAGDETERSFHASCVASCVQTGADEGGCAQSCHCIAGGLKEHGLWQAVLRRNTTPEEMERVMAVIRACRP